ncbi:hypothetical protein [Tumebacillus permanentifrigoris]|uniref:Uncharacterized protein n=1 Tax=Tumebacillus permanentifrigoris TaxID=378543 RepID=A0A316DDE0_9BACL|nr:hypothetical protein [Tumebacillus permanentifrigoris]PWK16241.1 hypothetical protein C7459_101104 [Tumebacillus permanentifrigoris]
MQLAKIFVIEHLSQDFTTPPTFSVGKNLLYLNYDYELETGGYAWTGLTFYEVIGYKKSYLPIVELRHISAYNSVCMEVTSPWLEEAKQTYRDHEPFEFNHYVIFFEDFGCYEVLAKDVKQGIHEF